MQLNALAVGKEPSDLIEPLMLNDRTKDQLRSAFHGVNLLNSLLSCRYQLTIMAQ
jgi:signal-transduction protein with cAMP-binding, CBS, and nucleotidyltransferase domain